MEQFQSTLPPLSLPPRLSIRQFCLHLVVSLAVLCVLCFGMDWIKQLYLLQIPLPVSKKQENYLQRFAERAPAFWVELGRNGHEQTTKIANDNYSLELENWHIGDAWQRTISWSLRSRDTAAITLSFDKAQPKLVALYLTDGDSIWRGGHVWLSERMQTFDRLHNGRWMEFHLSDEQRAAGKLQLRLYKLTGDEIAVSALAVEE